MQAAAAGTRERAPSPPREAEGDRSCPAGMRRKRGQRGWRAGRGVCEDPAPLVLQRKWRACGAARAPRTPRPGGRGCRRVSPHPALLAVRSDAPGAPGVTCGRFPPQTSPARETPPCALRGAGEGDPGALGMRHGRARGSNRSDLTIYCLPWHGYLDVLMHRGLERAWEGPVGGACARASARRGGPQHRLQGRGPPWRIRPSWMATPDFYVGRVPGPRHGPVVRGGEPGSLSTVPRRGAWLTPFWAVPVL